MTKNQIIDETIDYYQNNPRSVQRNSSGNDYCLYLGPNGENCGFSRCCTKKGIKLLHDKNEQESVQDFMLEYLKAKYKGHDLSFWEDVQFIHDTDACWRGKKLTNKGKDFINSLKQQYDKD